MFYSWRLKRSKSDIIRLVWNIIVVVLLFFCFFKLLQYFLSSGDEHLIAVPTKDVILEDHYTELDDLILVAGHAVYTSHDFDKNDIRSDKSWFLQPDQGGLSSAFVTHIKRGIELAAFNPRALLVFSGGETRKEAGPRSEAHSYWMVAQFSNWFGFEWSGVSNRTVTEEFARDSFENLLFGIARFREVTGHYPSTITVVGFALKRRRFEELHRKALRYPQHRFFYEGIADLHPVTGNNDTPATTSSTPGIAVVDSKSEWLKLPPEEREMRAAFAPFSKDPYGCADIKGILRQKRNNRNPFHRFHGYQTSCPEISGLFTYCQTATYPRSLPWESLT